MFALLPAVIEAGDTEIVTTGIAMTVSVVDLISLPAVLLHVRVYVKVPAVFIAPVLVVPLVPFAPVHEPEAVQDVGLLVADQLIVAALPVPMLVGFTAIVITGAMTAAPPAATDTLVDPTPLPPAFVQVSV
jgi:hypothetical protein